MWQVDAGTHGYLGAGTGSESSSGQSPAVVLGGVAGRAASMPGETLQGGGGLCPAPRVTLNPLQTFLGLFSLW